MGTVEEDSKYCNHLICSNKPTEMVKVNFGGIRYVLWLCPEHYHLYVCIFLSLNNNITKEEKETLEKELKKWGDVPWWIER